MNMNKKYNGSKKAPVILERKMSKSNGFFLFFVEWVNKKEESFYVKNYYPEGFRAHGFN